MTWNPAALPDQRGRTIVVTGATAGIGYFAAEQLPPARARVVLASRSPAKLAAARSAILEQVGGAEVDTVTLDLSSPESVANAVQALAAPPRLDGLLLNGGSMERTAATTGWGVPAILGTHVAANVALVTGLLPAFVRDGTAERPSRIVHTSSGFVGRASFDTRDIRATPRNWVAAYTKAKTL